MPGCSPLQNFPLQLIMTFCYNIILKFRGRLHYMCTKLPNHKAHTTLGIWHCSLTRLLFFTESSSRWPVFSSFSGPLYKSPTNRNLSFSSLGLLCLSSKYVVWQLETYQSRNILPPPTEERSDWIGCFPYDQKVWDSRSSVMIILFSIILQGATVKDKTVQKITECFCK